MKLLQHESGENVTWQAAFRFSIVIMAAALLGMSYGRSLTPDIASLCYVFGLNGLAFYFSLELVADQRAHRQATLLQRSAERKLSRRVWGDAKTALCHEEMKKQEDVKKKGEKKTEQKPLEIESAMDSTAGLEVYLGPTSQPVLSA